MRKLSYLFISALCLLLGYPLVAASADKAVATVNGKTITEKQFQYYLQESKAKRPKSPANTDRKAMINELVSRELIYQDALKKKLDKDPKVTFLINEGRKDILIQAALARSALGKPVTDEETKKLYKEKITNMSMKEYKARHILLKTEQDAKAIIAELDKGADFSKLAKEKSTGPSAKDGGDLGWFNPIQMVPEFSQAAADLKKGSYSKKPVKTQFGWHVILLEDSRTVEPPKYEDVKNRLRQVVQQQRLQQYVASLRKSAKIKIDQ